MQTMLASPEAAGNSYASWLDDENEDVAVCVVFHSWSYVSRDVLAGVRWEVHRNLWGSEDDDLDSPETMARELVRHVEEPLGWTTFRLIHDRHGIGWKGTVENGPPAVPSWVLEQIRKSR